MENTYEFCPKCGALVREGVCTGCGAVCNAAEEVDKWTGEEAESTGQAFEQENFENQMDNNQHMEERQQMQEVNSGMEPLVPERFEDKSQAYESWRVYGGDNYYGGQAPAGQIEPGRKKKNGVLIGVLAGTFLVVIILIIYIGSEVARLSKGNFIEEVKKAIEDISRESQEEKEYEMDGEADDDYWDEYEKEQSIQYDKDFKSERKNYDASQITGPYYEEFVNCIDESVSYKVNREFYEKIEEEQGVCIQVSYIQLEGDIPNLESINEAIKERSMVLANVYLDQEGYYKELYKEYDYATHYIKVESTVAFNDEESISIVLDERYDVAGYSNLIRLYGVNINLKTGTILENTEILNADEGFVNDFVERSNAQNGKNSVGVDQISNSEKLQLFHSNDNLILFYTPIGLEAGYNYSGVEGYSGWITVSIEDYEQYLKGY